MKQQAPLLMTAFLSACFSSRPEPISKQRQGPRNDGSTSSQSTLSDTKAISDDGQTEKDGSSPPLVFADRTSHAYLLLLEGTEKPNPPSRETLARWGKEDSVVGLSSDEQSQLERLIFTEPHRTDLDFEQLIKAPDFLSSSPNSPQLDEKERARRDDLLGVHIEILPIERGRDGLIPTIAYHDPILRRKLNEADRKSLGSRKWALLLRADYRNQHHLRGYRLLQALSEVVGTHLNAIIYDPDTFESRSLAAFQNERLSNEGLNVADQIAIVPFADPHSDNNSIRWTTRGMRRFGSVDLEIGGVPQKAEIQNWVSLLLSGLAVVMAREGEVHPSGLAVEVNETIRVTREDIEKSFSDGSLRLPSCSGCRGWIDIHLQRRAKEEHDPHNHPVARVVAPGETRNQAKHNHTKWLEDSLLHLFGPPKRPTPSENTASPRPKSP